MIFSSGDDQQMTDQLNLGYASQVHQVFGERYTFSFFNVREGLSANV